MTTNAPTGQQFQHGARFDTHYAAKMPPLELLALHERRVAHRVAENHTTVVPATTFDAMLASVCRMDRARAEHRASVGWVTRDEMRAVAGPKLARTSDAVFDAMQTEAAGNKNPS
jgi:hypothetical protein